MSEEIKRYDPGTCYDTVCMEECSDGDYVKYDDYAAMEQLADDYERLCQSKDANQAAQASTIVALKEQLASAQDSITCNVEELVDIAANLRDVKHWAAQASSRFLAEMADRMLKSRALASQPAAPVQPLGYISKFEKGVLDGGEAIGLTVFSEARLGRDVAIYAAPPVQQPGLSIIDIGHGETLRREAKTTGAVGWLRYSGNVLLHALNGAEIRLVESALRATTRPSAALTERVIHERDALAQAIRDAVVNAGMCGADHDLSGPQLIMFCGDMANYIIHMEANLAASGGAAQHSDERGGVNYIMDAIEHYAANRDASTRDRIHKMLLDDAINYRRLAASGGALAVPEGWQPIGTAPKDGRTLLLGRFNELGKWRTMRGQWFNQAQIDDEWEDPDGCEEGWYETAVEPDVPNCWPIAPTHWMFTPAAPAIPGESK